MRKGYLAHVKLRLAKRNSDDSVCNFTNHSFGKFPSLPSPLITAPESKDMLKLKGGNQEGSSLKLSLSIFGTVGFLRGCWGVAWCGACVALLWGTGGTAVGHGWHYRLGCPHFLPECLSEPWPLHFWSSSVLTHLDNGRHGSTACALAAHVSSWSWLWPAGAGICFANKPINDIKAIRNIIA